MDGFGIYLIPERKTLVITIGNLMRNEETSNFHIQQGQSVTGGNILAKLFESLVSKYIKISDIFLTVQSRLSQPLDAR